MILCKHDKIPGCIGLVSFYEGTKFTRCVNKVRELIGRKYFGNQYLIGECQIILISGWLLKAAYIIQK